MNSRIKGYVQLIIFFLFIGVLIRFFPFVARLASAAAYSVRMFWWLILILVLAGLSLWILRRKTLLKTKTSTKSPGEFT